MRDNTCILVERELKKIKRLKNELGWKIHRIDHTTSMLERNGKKAEDVWEEVILKKSELVMDL